MKSFRLISRTAIALCCNLSPVVVVGSSAEFNLSEVLRNGTFGDSFPTETQLTKKYGDGCVEKRFKEVTFHTYFISNRKVWIRCKVESNETAHRPVTEVLFTRLSMCTKRIDLATRVEELELRGVHLNDRISKAKEIFGTPLRVERRKLAEQEVDVYVFLPTGGPLGLGFEVYVRDEVVIAAAVSASE